MGVCEIEIGEGDRPRCGVGAVFCHVAGLGVAGDDDVVIGARDGDGDGLIGGITVVVVHRDGEGFGECFADAESLNVGVVVIECVGPTLAAADAIGGCGDGIEREGSVAGGA